MKVFTTGQVAKICKVSPRTVTQWCDRGLLQHRRVPGSLDRRIDQEPLVQFFKDNNMPLDWFEEEEIAKVLIIAPDLALLGGIRQNRTWPDSFGVDTAEDAFAAGCLISQSKPDCIVVDCDIGEEKATQLCYQLRQNPEFASIHRIALVSGGSCPMLFTSVDEIWPKPFEVDLLGERLTTLISAKKDLV